MWKTRLQKSNTAPKKMAQVAQEQAWNLGPSENRLNYCLEAAGAVVLVSLLTVFFAFLTCFLPFFMVLSVCVVELAVEFCAFFVACGAADRKGTATTVNKVDVNNFFMMFSPLMNVAVFLNGTESRQLLNLICFFSLPLFPSLLPPLTTLLCAFFASATITPNRDSLSRVFGIAANFS
jgi:hypothetical protein